VNFAAPPPLGHPHRRRDEFGGSQPAEPREVSRPGRGDLLGLLQQPAAQIGRQYLLLAGGVGRP
jgi:hypothetical protein